MAINKQSDLSATKIKKLEDKFDDIKEKLKAFEDKLTPLGVKTVHVTPPARWVFGGAKSKVFWGYVWKVIHWTA